MRDAATAMRWILHANIVIGRSHFHRGFKSRPCGWNAGIDDKKRTLAADAQNALDTGTIHPPGCARVPGPSPAPDMRRDGIDIGSDDVGVLTANSNSGRMHSVRGPGTVRWRACSRSFPASSRDGRRACRAALSCSLSSSPCATSSACSDASVLGDHVWARSIGFSGFGCTDRGRAASRPWFW